MSSNTGSNDAEFEAKLAELKSRVRASIDYNYTDTAYVRFLRGFKGIVDNAVDGMIQTYNFRMENNADNIQPSEFAAISEKGIAIVHGRDKNDRPVIAVMVYRHDKDDRNIDEVRKYIIYTLDHLVANAKPEEEKITLIFDLSKFTLKCMDFEGVQLLISILQKNYPEILSVALVLNAPFIFWACWSVIKPWIDPVTAKKVEFITGSTITNFVSEDELIDDLKACLPRTPSSSSK